MLQCIHNPTNLVQGQVKWRRKKPAKELVIDSGAHVSVRDGKRQTKCSIRNELEFAQALTRRALAFDLMGVCFFFSDGKISPISPWVFTDVATSWLQSCQHGAMYAC